MLSIHTLTSVKQAENYYEKDDYYTKEGKLKHTSKWSGELAKQMNLGGSVKKREFIQLLSGNLPNKQEISTNKKGKTPGVDLTFSAPKSVSLACFLGDEDRIKRAHDEAIKATMEWAENECVQVRRTHQKRTVNEKTKGLLYAKFEHEVSRELDPQLHSHCVVLNVAKDSDGNYRALKNTQLYRRKMLLGVMYRSELAVRLKKLGYEVEKTGPDGTFEIRGFEKKHLEHFSKRSQQIKEKVKEIVEISKKLKDDLIPKTKAERAIANLSLDEDGKVSARIKALVTKDSRVAKKEYDREKVSEEWRQEAKQIGLEFSAPKELKKGKQVVDNVAAMDAGKEAVEHHSDRKAVVRKFDDYLRYSLENGVGDFTAKQALSAYEKLQQNKNTINKVLVLNDSTFTTEKAEQMEKTVLKIVEKGRGKFDPILDKNLVREEIQAINQNLQKDHGPEAGLSKGQADAIELALTSKDKVVAIQGYAGTGKTFSLEAVRRLAEREGYQVEGYAPTASAAAVLEKDAGIKSTTIAKKVASKHLNLPATSLRASAKAPKESARAKELSSTSGAVDKLKTKKPKLWVVDESSMISNKLATEIMQMAQKEKARVVLVGDREQIPAVEAGKPFSLLMEKKAVKVATVDKIMRQKEELLKGAVLDTIKSDQKNRDIQALKKLEEAKTVFELRNRANRMRKVVSEFMKSPDNQMVITARNADRRDLNTMIRASMQRKNMLEGEKLNTTILKDRGHTDAQIKNVLNYEVGDKVTFQKNYRRYKVKKGQTCNVVGVDNDLKQVILDIDGKHVRWQPWKHSKVSLSREEEREIQKGDRIRWTENDHKNQRINGIHARILEVDDKKGIAQYVELDKEGKETEKKGVLKLTDQKKWEYGYVSTIYSSQGQTVDKVLVHVDTKRDRPVLGHEAWYVAISRARYQAKIFTDRLKDLPKAISRSMQKHSALQAT